MTTWHYDTLGNPTYSTDPASTLRQTTYDYSDVWADSSCIGAGTVARAFPTTVTDPAGFQRKTSYYTCTGLLHSTRDQNDINAGRAGTTMSYDEVNRPLTTNYPDGGQASLNYNGDPVPPSVTKTQLASPDPSIVSTTVLDGLGRVAHSQLNSDPEGVDYTDTTYDALGHVLTTSNAYRTVASAATDGTYCNGTKNNGACISGYDALGRLTISTKQDGSVVRTDYSAYPTVTVTDEAGRQRQTVTDALGRLVDVYEPNPTTGSLTSGSFHTHYTFDVLGNLKQVIQYGNGTPRTRTFHYDSISRLIDATTPESGTITYSYAADTTCNPNGVDLRTKTDARGITTTYCYDVLHRVTQQAYSDGTPQVTFNYDEPNPFGFNGVAANTIGRLSSEFTGVSPHLSGTGFAYDAVGRIVFQGQCGKSNCGTGNVPSSPYQVSASYDLAGNINSFNYPSTRSLSQTNSGAGRLLTVNYAYFNGLSVNYSYLNVPIGSTPQTWGYMPPGLLQIENKGNGTVDTISYNSRLQMSQVTGGSTARTWFNRSIDYGTANNGNVQHVYDNLGSGRSQTFGYDQINRIVSASTTATTGPDAWSETFNSDAWGNVTQSGGNNFNQAFNSNNQIVGYSYDAAGCLLSDTFHTYAYDAECRITSVDSGSATYIYGADGQRTRKDYAGDWTEYVYFKGQPIAEVNSSGDWTDYVYANGKRIAEAEALNRDLHIYGTTTGSGQYAVFNFANTAGLNGYTIHSGDTLYLAQYQPTGSKGGMILSFTDGSNSNWSVTDQYGYYLNDDQHQTPTYMRQIDLSSLAGKTINKVAVNDEDDTAAGSWNIYFDDISLVSSDGTAHPIYTGETSASFSLGSHTSGETSLGSKIDTNRGKATHVNDTTTYYTADHLGSARMITAPRGYPIWSGVFLPYGEEWNPQITMNHYKLTGKERDSENGAPGNGLDYFGARYYSSAMGRWMTPDWAEQDELDALPSGDAADPQTLNLYAYVRNNPVSQVDPDGHHQECVTTMTLEYSKDHKEAVYQVHTDCHEILDPTPVTVVSRFQIALNRLINGGNALGPGGRAEIQDYCGANALVPSVCYDMWSHLGPLLPSGELPFALSTKPAIVPKNWTEKPTYKNDGRIYIDPTNTHNRVRVMDDGYMKVQKNGQTLDVNGNPVPSSSPEAHIPVNSVMESPFEGPFE